jgi:hypothetical protein
VRAPPLVSQNRFTQLSVDNIKDHKTNIDTIVVNSIVVNGRGSQETELSALEACLIPSQNNNQLDNNKPKEGVTDKKYFIRTARVEREVVLDVTITMLDMHDSCMVKALLDSRATRLFID